MKGDDLTKVVIESPFMGKTNKETMTNIKYVRACARDCLLNHDEAPYASHLLYPQPGILDDGDPEERQYGIDAGLLWGREAEKTIVYTDRGISKGMKYGIEGAKKAGRPVEYRKLGKNWEKKHDKLVEKVRDKGLF